MNLFWTVRQVYVRIKLAIRYPQIKISANTKIGLGTSFSPGRTITIDDAFFCGRYCHFAAPATIGKDVMFASFVSLVGGDHCIDGINTPIKYSGRTEMKMISIADNVWIGHGAIILHGCSLGEGCVVGAGAVVIKDVEPNAVVGGNPAKFIRYRRL